MMKYNTQRWQKRFKKLKKNPKRACKALSHRAYVAFRRRLVKVRQPARPRRVSNKMRRLERVESSVYSFEGNSADYRKFRRLLTQPRIKTKYTLKKWLTPGRYTSFDHETEQGFIRQATTLASIVPVAKAKGIHKYRILKVARELYKNVVETSGYRPRSLRKTQKQHAVSTTYLQRVQRESPGLWKDLMAVIRENTRKALGK
jgi:hypothetical protein